MTVADLICELRQREPTAEVIVCDGDNEWDVVLTDGHDGDMRPCVVVDLTADCGR